MSLNAPGKMTCFVDFLSKNKLRYLLQVRGVARTFRMGWPGKTQRFYWGGTLLGKKKKKKTKKH